MLQQHLKRIEKLKVKELKQELRQLKLKVSGKKSILQNIVSLAIVVYHNGLSLCTYFSM